MTITETLKTLGDTSQPLAWRSLKELSNIGPESQAELHTAWQRIETTRRQEITAALGELAEDDIEFNFRQVFRNALEDADEQVRVSALDGLWEDNSLGLMHVMMDLLRDDPSGQVRAAAAVGLGRYAYLGELDELDTANADAVRDALYEATNNEEQPSDVRRRALESLGYRGAEPQIERLIGAAYADTEQLMRESAVVAMGRSMQPRWLDAIGKELGSISPALRYEAARAAGEMGDQAEPLLARLLPLVDDEDGEVSTATIWALGQVGGPHAQRVLQRIARSKNDTRRQAATDALEELTLGEDDAA